MKVRYQHIHEVGVLSFTVDPYTDIDTVELLFSLKDLQYLWYHFQVISAVSLFGPATDEIERVA